MRPESKFRYVNHDLRAVMEGCAQASSNVRYGSKADIMRCSNFDAVPTAVDADQEADLIIRGRQRIADDLASEVQTA